MNEYRTFMKDKKEGDFLATCKRLKKEGRKVEAVKLYRREKQCALKPAMEAIEAL
jgi:acyl-coenzyme A thioesterase PaaI-like protein